MSLPLASPEFPDHVLAILCSFLGPSELGRLACVSRRFTQPALTEPGSGRGKAKLSAIEEGARLRVEELAGPAGAVRTSEETWLRTLWLEEFRLAFVPCPGLTTSEGGTRCFLPRFGVASRRVVWALPALLERTDTSQ